MLVLFYELILVELVIIKPIIVFRIEPVIQ